MAVVPYRVAAEMDRQLETRTFQLGGQTLIIRQARTCYYPYSFACMLAPLSHRPAWLTAGYCAGVGAPGEGTTHAPKMKTCRV